MNPSILPQVNIYHPTGSYASQQRHVAADIAQGAYMRPQFKPEHQEKGDHASGQSWDSQCHTAPPQINGAHTCDESLNNETPAFSLPTERQRLSRRDEQIEFSANYCLRPLKKKTQWNQRESEVHNESLVEGGVSRVNSLAVWSPTVFPILFPKGKIR